MTEPVRTTYEKHHPSDDEIEGLRAANASYLELRGLAAQGRPVDHLDWLDRLPNLKRLYLSGATIALPPDKVIRQLDELSMQGPARPALNVGLLGDVPMLELRRPSDVQGTVAASKVATLRLSGHDESDLEFVSGADSLVTLNVWGRGQLIDRFWTQQPRHMSDLRLEGVDVASLEDLCGMSRLESFVMFFPTSRRSGPPLDLSPLAACPSLRWISIAAPVKVTGLQALRALGSLESISFARQSQYDSGDAAGLPLA